MGKDRINWGLNALLLTFSVLTFLFAGVIVYTEKGIVEFAFYTDQPHGVRQAFSILTWIGDGKFCVIISLLAFLFNRYAGLLSLSSYLLSGGIAQLLKRTIFQGMERPLAYWESIAELSFHAPEGLPMQNSFPSGHTASAFALAATIAIICRNTRLAIILSFVALLVGLSRISAGLHFFEDVMAGMAIGVASTYWLHTVFQYLRVDTYLLNKRRTHATAEN